jgi:reverse gyrase
MAKLAENPKGSTVRTDEQGSYVAYHKICNNCQVELTSRNRALCGSLKCMTCLSVNSRDRWRETNGWPNQVGRLRKLNPDGTALDRLPVKRPVVDSVSKTEKLMESHHTVSPESQRVHALLTRFLMHPTITGTKEALLGGLVDYELKERFRYS